MAWLQVIIATLILIASTVHADTLLVPIRGSSEAWEITTFGTRIVNTWRSNYDMCKSRGAMLLEVYNSDMADQVKSLISTGGIWLGILYRTDSDFSWSSGEKLDFTNWARGYPNTNNGNYYAYIRSDGTWENVHGNADMKAACMKKINRPAELISTTETDTDTAEYKPKIYLAGMILHVDEKPTDWLTAYYYCKTKGLTLSTILTPSMNMILTKISERLGYAIWLPLVGAGGKFWWMNGVPFQYNELAETYDITGRDSTYTLLKQDGKWHDSCPTGDRCGKGLAVCLEIAPQSTGEPEKPTTFYTQYETTGPTTTYYQTESITEAAAQEETACLQSIKEARQRELLTGGAYVYIPTCHEDGAFTALQCELNLAGLMTCWCVKEDGKLITESVDVTRALTTEECDRFRAGITITDDNIIQGAATTDMCVVEGKSYRKGQQFRVECNICTCWGNDQFACSPSTECTEEMILCRYVDSFAFACSSCRCDGPRFSSFKCVTYDRNCQTDPSNEEDTIWFADGTQSTETTTDQPQYDNYYGREQTTDEYEIVTHTGPTTGPSTEPTPEPTTEPTIAPTETYFTTSAKATTERGFLFRSTAKEGTESPVTTLSDSTEKQYKVILYMSNKVSTWLDAYYDCQSMGMTLPTGVTEVLNNYMQNYLRQHQIEIWLDAEQSNGYAYWFSGEPMDWTNWAPYSEPKYQYGRAYGTLSYDGMWYAKSDYETSSYYCIKLEEVSTKAVKRGFLGTCLIGEKEYYQGETFGTDCNRCTCYLYSTVYVDCVRTADCIEVTTTPPKPVIATTLPRRVKSKCHGGVRYLDCSSPCSRECEDRDCRKHCTEECSCPNERPVFYGGCCVAEAVCIDDGYESWSWTS